MQNDALGRTGCSVLIVEDDADLQDMMVQIIGLEGFNARAAANGREALAYLRAHQPPNVILLDLMMPVMDGWQFRREQQRDAELAKVPIVVLSAFDQIHAGDFAMNTFLKKPIDFDRLLKLVRQYCQ